MSKIFLANLLDSSLEKGLLEGLTDQERILY
jgi:hypothetical protein